MAGEAVRAVLGHVLSALEPLGHPCALVGGLALAVWNHPRATRDVDLLIAVDSANLDPVIDQLRAHGCRPKKSPPLVTIDRLRLAQFLYTPPGEFYDVQFDLLLAECDFQKSALSRRVPRDISGVHRPVDVLQCDDLILHKLLAGRLIDRADAAILLRENRDAIDFDYMQVWILSLGLSEGFGETWREAFPDEAPPVRNAK
ncbi:MAG: nucleotidyl transferase AbiEii/AbiGii toxin family protein [Pirellulales bacterium]